MPLFYEKYFTLGKNFKIHEKVKIKFNENKFYAFNKEEELISSPYGVYNG